MGQTISVRDVVRQAVNHGLCVVPPKENGTKQPETALVNGEWTWKHWQHEPPSIAQLNAWYRGTNRAGVGILTGAPSGGVELFEFDDEDVYVTFRDTAEAVGLGELVTKIEAGYVERTPGGGYHWLYRCTEVSGNTKLARRRVVTDDGPRIDPLIETRGEGGYAVLAPSGGPVHPSGKPYELLSGGVERIATITPEERRALFQLAQAFDELPKEAAIWPGEPLDVGGRPGDDFNARATWESVLTPAGWVRLATRGDVTYWRRPGKDRGISASTNWHGSDLLYVWSTSTPFQTERGYAKWRAYAILSHAGDFQAAAKELARQGYGTRQQTRVKRAASTPNGTHPSPAPAIFPLTDTGNAERLVAQHGGELRYNWARDKWHVWSGRHWQVDSAGLVEQRAKDTVRAIPAEAEGLTGERYSAILKWAAGSESGQRRRAMVRLAQSELGIPVQPHELDADPWLLNVANGTLDLRNGSLGRHVRSDLITRLIDTPYAPDTACPKWLAFLEQIFAGDHALIRYVQRLLGYALTGSTREQLIVIAYGTGSNGKSTLVGVMRRLLGDYAREANADSFMDKRGDAIREDIADLEGARFVAASETADGRRLSEALVKKMTGGERLRARRLYENGYEFEPTFKLWLSTNHRPTIRGSEYAIWRRIKLVPFTVTIADEEKDLDLTDKLLAESPGILAWAVEGCQGWQRHGLGEPPAVTDAVAAYRLDMDALAEWIEATCIVHPTVRDEPRRLYESYADYCRTNDQTPMSETAFGRKLGEKGHQLQRTHATKYRIGIRRRGDDAEPLQASFGLADAESERVGFESVSGCVECSQELSEMNSSSLKLSKNPTQPDTVVEPDAAPNHCLDCGTAIGAGTARCSPCAAAAVKPRGKRR